MTPATRYEPVIGLETHVQLDTLTKMFCGCRNVFGQPPNSLTCPVCTGMPGALPVANEAAFELAVRVGLGLGATIAHVTRFDRKNYFYPDLPKGYQITQFETPIVAGGLLPLESGKQVRILRAHLEEDAGKGLHQEEGTLTLIDLNRCGVPLLEIVTEPDMGSSQEAHQFLTRLRLLLRYLEVSECEMEKGSLRCDVNVSLRPEGREDLGTRTEIKNLNSFRFVERAIEHEIERQTGILRSGGEIEQATLLWDEDSEETRLMRTKEKSADYRYFRDPDLPAVHVDEAWIGRVRAALPELPWIGEERLERDLALSAYDAHLLVQDRKVADFFEEVTRLCNDPKAAANWITGELFGLMKRDGRGLDETPTTAEAMAEIISMVAAGRIGVSAGRRVLAAVYKRGDDPQEIVEALGISQVSDAEEIRPWVEAAVSVNPRAVADVKAGKKKALGAIVGHVMKLSAGRANPATVHRILADILRKE